MKLHASEEDYLETILVLQKKRGMVRSVDVARHLEVSKPSVCHVVATLRDGGFLMMDEDHFLHLTDVGREVAEKIYERHCFFTVRRSARYSYNFQPSSDRCKSDWQQAFAVSFWTRQQAALTRRMRMNCSGLSRH